MRSADDTSLVDAPLVEALLQIAYNLNSLLEGAFMKKIRPLWVLIGCVFLGASHRTTSPFITPAIAVLEDGQIVTESTDPEAIKREIKNQVKFTIGALNEIGGGAAIESTLHIELKDRIRENTVAYKARLLIAYPQQYVLPQELQVVLPASGSRDGLKSFYDAYSPRCSSENHGWSSYFYDYRPMRCGLSQQAEPALGWRATFALEVQEEHLDAKPETQKVWEDGKYNVIAIFGNTNSTDSTRSAVQFRQYLYNWFGTPIANQMDDHGRFSVQTMQFRAHKGVMVVSLFDLFDGNVQTLGESFKSAFEALTPDADLVAYNGHSGLGANVGALTHMGVFKPDQYQVYFLNGCDSFSYVDGRLAEAHVAQNPESAPTKYLDLILTVLPSAFEEMAYGTARVVLGLHTGSATYYQMLSNIRNASPLVIGEEDNEE